MQRVHLQFPQCDADWQDFSKNRGVELPVARSGRVVGAGAIGQLVMQRLKVQHMPAFRHHACARGVP